MKSISTFVLFLFLTIPGFAKDPGEKTFLIIFDKSELKELKTSTEYIELSLMALFKTKAYTGNSDAAILVKVPYGNIDENQLGDMFVRLNREKIVSLQEVAFQIIDLEKSKAVYETLLASYEEKSQKSKTKSKQGKAISAN
ncbi:hypothetical protein A33Q_0682 [Indibacter alkaliphilus LW1]|uniref:DUF4174 domain-containing protein n=1 Tax=Indibacter alkaliphilus (strain CCUG 57479 / KCTC 22604 / LW1) TaxID=1189612 RepID=S2DJP0_INDAL|nr:hypothetical protein [Indibacter alkaliphilus]EOZ99304.1 hypothetical protein A33Q_0682 [Indibacter alkaliphilus LW1]